MKKNYMTTKKFKGRDEKGCLLSTKKKAAVDVDHPAFLLVDVDHPAF